MVQVRQPALWIVRHLRARAVVAALLDTPAFVAALRDAQAQMKEHGAQAGFVFRSRALAEDLLPDIYSLAKDTRTDAALRHRMFESLARYALLDPATTKKGDAGGVRVVFNLAGGIRGVEHVVQSVQPYPMVKGD